MEAGEANDLAREEDERIYFGCQPMRERVLRVRQAVPETYGFSEVADSLTGSYP
jgi:hypothetical protein